VNNTQIKNLREALVLNNVILVENGRLDEASFKRLLKEAEEIEETAEEIEEKSGGNISKRDGISLITAIYGGLGAIPGVAQTPIAKLIDVTLAIKFLYDASQAINSIASLNDVIEKVTGKDALSPLNQIVPYGLAAASSDLLNREDLEAIRTMPAQEKEKAKQYAIAAFQYNRRAIVSGLGMLPDITLTGGVDLTLAAMGAALSMSKSFDKSMISMVKAVANVSRQFKTLHKWASADNMPARALRIIVNWGGMYNLGMTMHALGILEPGTGDKLEQIVNPAGASRSETELEVVNAIRQREKEKMDSDKEGMSHRKRRRALDIELEKERQMPPPPGVVDVTPSSDQRMMQESANIAVQRWQVLSGIK